MPRTATHPRVRFGMPSRERRRRRRQRQRAKSRANAPTEAAAPKQGTDLSTVPAPPAISEPTGYRRPQVVVAICAAVISMLALIVSGSGVFFAHRSSVASEKSARAAQAITSLSLACVLVDRDRTLRITNTGMPIAVERIEVAYSVEPGAYISDRTSFHFCAYETNCSQRCPWTWRDLMS